MNKKLGLFFLLFFIFFAGCNSSNNPQEVVEIFLHDISTGNFSHARNYATSSTYSHLINAETFLFSNETVKFHPVNYKIEKIEVKGDTARCFLIWDDTKENFLIIRRHGKWLVDINLP